MSNWWKGAVIYQIYPRSFMDSNNDGMGDLKGIISKLDYVASLGVDGIWLSPIFTSPMHDHGYDVADYRDIDPMFGTLADFDALMAKAHKLGLKVIIDQVYSHTSDQHTWFQESRQTCDNSKADWYVWADPKPDGSPPNNWQSIFGGIGWTWEAKRQQYYLHNFVKQQPDLNFHCAAVQEEILDTAKFWLDRGVDGFRLDVVNFFFHHKDLPDNPPYDPEKNSVFGLGPPTQPYFYQDHIYDNTQPENLAFLERLRGVIDSYDARMTVGEIGGTFETSVEYTQGESRLHTGYSFPFLMSPELNAPMIQHILTPWNSVDAWPSWSFSNHDVPRAPSRYGVEHNPKFAKLLIALLTCLRGTAFLYQGEELGLPQADVPLALMQDPAAVNTGDSSRSRDGCRTPMPWEKGAMHSGFSDVPPWLPVDPRHDAMAIDQLEGDPNSVLNFTRNFLKFRKQHPALITGDLNFLTAPESVLMFERKAGTETFVCGFNLSDKNTSIDVTDLSLLECGFDTPQNSGTLILDGYQGFIAVRN